MRISTIQSFNAGVAAISRASADSNATQTQISTGTKFRTPADDPVAAARIVQLNADIASRDQFQNNVTAATNRLSLEESVLDGVVNVLQRVREITVQAGNGALSEADRGFLAQEVEARQQELVALMNSRDPAGEYLFAGYQGGSAPWVESGPGYYRFTGDEGERVVQIGADTWINARDSGKKIFEDIEAAAPRVVTTANPRNAGTPAGQISAGIVRDREQFEAFAPADLYIEFNPTHDLDPAAANFTVRRQSDGRVMDALANVVYIPGAEIEVQGVAFRIGGYPAPEDTFQVESSTRQGVLTSIGDLVAVLREPDGDRPPGGYQEELDRVLTNIDNEAVEKPRNGSNL